MEIILMGMECRRAIEARHACSLVRHPYSRVEDPARAWLWARFLCPPRVGSLVDFLGAVFLPRSGDSAQFIVPLY